MKKIAEFTVSVLLAVTFLCTCFTAQAYSDETINMDIPKGFESSETGTEAKMWINNDTGSNLVLSIAPNDALDCFSNLSQEAANEYFVDFTENFKSNVSKQCEEYGFSVEYGDSDFENVQINGQDGLLINIEGRYVYSEDNKVDFASKSYLFSTYDDIIGISLLIKSSEDEAMLEVAVNSLVIADDIYSDAVLESVSTVIAIVIILIIPLALLAVLIVVIVLISRSRKKKKLQKNFSQNPYYNGTYTQGNMNQPNNMNQNYGMPNNTNQPNYGMPDPQRNMNPPYGAPNQPNNMNGNYDMPNNSYSSPDLMNPNGSDES